MADYSNLKPIVSILSDGTTQIISIEDQISWLEAEEEKKHSNSQNPADEPGALADSIACSERYFEHLQEDRDIAQKYRSQQGDYFQRQYSNDDQNNDRWYEERALARYASGQEKIY